MVLTLPPSSMSVYIYSNQIAILMGCAVLPHLRQMVEIVEHGLVDEQQKVSSSCWWKFDCVGVSVGSVFVFVLMYVRVFFLVCFVFSCAPCIGDCYL